MSNMNHCEGKSKSVILGNKVGPELNLAICELSSVKGELKTGVLSSVFILIGLISCAILIPYSQRVGGVNGTDLVPPITKSNSINNSPSGHKEKYINSEGDGYVHTVKLESILNKSRGQCPYPFKDEKLPNGLFDRYRFFVDKNARVLIYMNMSARDTTLEMFDLKNMKYGKLPSYKNSWVIGSLLTPQFFETQLDNLEGEKSCNINNGSLVNQDFFSCEYKKGIWYSTPEGGGGYECRWLNQ